MSVEYKTTVELLENQLDYLLNIREEVELVIKNVSNESTIPAIVNFEGFILEVTQALRIARLDEQKEKEQ